MSKSNFSQDHDRIINTTAAVNARWAAIDAQERNRIALANNKFFGTKQHQSKVDAVQGIVDGFFKAHGGVYVNHRENRGKPFTTVKVTKPQFPAVSQKRKQSEYLDPLRALGVEIVFSKQTNSYLFHVR